ncbi:cupin domain-containing protein [Candidimonas nitroreducens]|uniref:Cupin n=1 Tax=Candidimonas nitroreducens TaxID=683354 RepID=A0A225MFX6_9BURK|nr:cupin domain-containing protein [Candidimonas nitroreducens]OWT60155.1 cupin [Candidimonas nitroreducens]
MNINRPLALLGGLTPQAFMRRYWQRRPLLIRQAIPGFHPGLSIADIRALVRREEVESRLVWQDTAGWHMKHGPFARLPAMRRPGWTALAQSVDLHDDATAELMQRFRFIADARLDDAMISIASEGGGVGPHFDSYDVFLLQAEGRRRWRIGSQQDLDLVPGLPLKILRDFRPETEYVLEPGDMLYLPPHIAHEGVALDACMTISVGFRAPTLAVLARGMLEAAGDQIMARAGGDGGLYGNPPLPGPDLGGRFRDAGTAATTSPARLPDTLLRAACEAVQCVRLDEALAARYLGMWLSEPPQAAYFEPPDEPVELEPARPATGRLELDRCTRLLYRGSNMFINGELAPLPASAVLRRLADERRLPLTPARLRALGPERREMLNEWLSEGWLHYRD